MRVDENGLEAESSPCPKPRTPEQERADVVAWLCQLADPRWCQEDKAEWYRVLWARIYDGEHVGAASKEKKP